MDATPDVGWRGNIALLGNFAVTKTLARNDGSSRIDLIPFVHDQRISGNRLQLRRTSCGFDLAAAEIHKSIAYTLLCNSVGSTLADFGRTAISARFHDDVAQIVGGLDSHAQALG